MEYGYLWWRGRQTINGRPIEGFWAQGNGGQVILSPDSELGGRVYRWQLQLHARIPVHGHAHDYILPAMLPPGPKKTFISPDKQTLAALPGAYRFNQLHLDLFVEGAGLAGRMAGQKAGLIFEGKDRFFMPSPIFGNMNGKILRGDHGKPIGLLINTAFSKLRFNKSD